MGAYACLYAGCRKSYASRKSLNRHCRQVHSARSPPNSASPPTPSHGRKREAGAAEGEGHTKRVKQGWPRGYEPEIQRLIGKKWNFIRSKEHSNRRVMDTYNVQMHGFEIEKLEAQLLLIYDRLNTAFKINICLGYVLRKKHTNTYRYFYASQNSSLLSIPRLIASRPDVYHLIEDIKALDIEAMMATQRPDTSFVFKTVTNTLIYVFKIANHAIGGETDEGTEMDPEIRAHITNHKAIHSFLAPTRGGLRHKLCFFDCLSFHNLKKKRVQRESLRLFHRWTMHKGLDTNPARFPGVMLDDIPELEDFFQIDIRVYSLEKTPIPVGGEFEDVENEAVEKIHCTCIVKPRGIYKNLMNLNLNSSHFSYITDLSKYAKSWRCAKCDRFFDKASNYNRHIKIMSCSETKKIYPGGGFGLTPTIFQQLEDNGIFVQEDLRFFNYRAVYDFECRFEDIDDDEQDGTKLKFTKQLIPASYSISSNVPGCNGPVCRIKGKPRRLIKRFVKDLEEISRKSQDIMEQRYSNYTEMIEVKVQAYEKYKELLAKAKNEKNVDAIEELEFQVRVNRKWEKMLTQFRRWLRQLPVIGFNSGKFDLNLIKDHLIRYLLQNPDHEGCIQPVKRGNNYMSVSLENVHLLDITNYLAAGTSYDKWIKAFQIEQTKGIWPYEWFKSMKNLDQTYLPDKEQFYSTLKQKGISDEDYAMISATWEREGFKTMRDMLIWYNNLDVEPFLEATEKMFLHFKGMGIDMFKQGAISLPGLAMIHMFSGLQPDEFFQLFSDETKEWQAKIRDNIVGGPSVIFNRFQLAGETAIRGGKPTRSILGYDANALYLYCTGQLMPIGLATTYEPKTELYNEIPVVQTNVDVKKLINQNMQTRYRMKKTHGEGELRYVLWTFEQLQKRHPSVKLTLNHRYNGGQKYFQVQRKNIPVDGYVPELNTIIQYHGCYFCGRAGVMAVMRLDNLLQAHKAANVSSSIETSINEIPS